MSRIVHLSDLHFGAHTPGLAERLAHQLGELEPDLIVISGDLTQRAKHNEFRDAAAFIRELPAPSLVVPGNHDLSTFDLPERMLFPWGKWKQHISRVLEPTVTGPDFVAVGLNTARRVNLHFDWSRGRINLAQVMHVERELAKQPKDFLRIVVTHHPFTLTDAAKSRGVIGRLGMAAPRFEAAGVDLVLSGHIHLAYAKLCRGIIVANAGSGISHRLKGEANSFNLITADKDYIEILQMAWQNECFVPGRKQCFERGEKGFKETSRQSKAQTQALATQAEKQAWK